METEPNLPIVDVVSDVVCPWCYIGKRHLDAALATLAEAGQPLPTVRWHPYELNPDLPAEGVDRRDYLERKFGGPARAAQVYDRVRRAGTQAGIAFDFERIALQPNTRDAHRLIAWAQTRGDATALVERLFRAYFAEGADLTSRATLEALARDAGLGDDAIRAALDDGDALERARRGDEEARGLGVGGVPFFVVDGRIGVSGAQGADALVAAFAQARGSASAPG